MFYRAQVKVVHCFKETSRGGRPRLGFQVQNLLALKYRKSSQVTVNPSEVEPGGLPYTRRSLCSPHPFFGQTCLPPALKFFMPLQTLLAERLRYLSVPLLNAYVVKVCPPTDSVWKEGNSNKSWKEIIKEVETEAEKERLPDNTNTEVNGKEVESEYFVKKESSLETEESERTEIKSTINRVSGETEISSENESPERPPREKNIYDENISITSNLV